MRVLLVSVFPPVAAPEANHALHLGEQLAAAGVEVHVLCQTGAIAATRAGITVHPLAADWSWSDLPKILRCIRDVRPDIVYLLYLPWIYNDQPMITFLPTIGRRRFPGLPFVTQFEAIGAIPGRSLAARLLRHGLGKLSRGGLHPVHGALMRDSARVIALSSPHRDSLLRSYPAAAGRTVVLPPPPLIRRSREEPGISRRRIRAQWGVKDSDFVLMYWGFIYPGKGVETLLRAFRAIAGDFPQARLALVGGDLDVPFGRMRSADYHRMVRALPARLGIAERVIRTGGFDWDSEQGSQYLFAGDACILPLDWGITLNNSSLAAAATHGLPVLGTELAGPPDEALHHGQNVYLVPPRDPAALAEGLAHLLADADLRARLRQGGAALAAEWHSWPRMTARLLDLFAAAQATAAGTAAPVEAAGTAAPVEAAGTAAPVEAAGTAAPATAPAIAPVTAPVMTAEARARAEAGFPTDPPTPSFEARQAEAAADGADGADAPETAPPRVSVIVAVHNVGRYLSQCLDALVNQTLTEIEILVVDDASTDDSAAIAAAYAARHPSLRIITCRVNQGLASVRNIGLLHARGEYVAFADGDDWVDVRMCEVMYARARADAADVLSASATVFYDDRKTFAPLFDWHVRQNLDPGIKAHPFALADEPRALQLEVVAWTKLYRRAFLLAHDLRFEDGLNSYEDICFHVFCMLKAERISVIDEPLIYYRQNRPGQISGRTSRKVFEVFEVFRRIHARLHGWDVPDEIWAQVLRLELRQYDWLLTDRVPAGDRAEFMARAAERLREVPEGGWRRLRHPGAREVARRLSLRRGWRRGHRLAHGRSSLPSLAMALLFREGRASRAGSFRADLATLGRETGALVRAAARRLPLPDRLRERLKALRRPPAPRGPALPAGPATGLVRVVRLGDQVLFLALRPGHAEMVERVARDVYLAQTAILREGDTIIDVGAHVGLWSIQLARKFPSVTVYALEPDPENHACLVKNLALNDVRNVVPVNAALAADDGRRRLYADPVSGLRSTLDARLAAGCEVLNVVEVETITLGQLCDRYGIAHCRMLKISAWGAVREVLDSLPARLPIDYLCGEADPAECGRTRLAAASARAARHFFWRLTAATAAGPARGVLHQLPQGIEPAPAPATLDHGEPLPLSAGDGRISTPAVPPPAVLPPAGPARNAHPRAGRAVRGAGDGPAGRRAQTRPGNWPDGAFDGEPPHPEDRPSGRCPDGS